MIDIEHLPGPPVRRLRIIIEFCPTVPHCSLASLIGLAIRLKLMLYFPQAKVDILVSPGKHKTEKDSAFEHSICWLIPTAPPSALTKHKMP
jgi:hypothetical protein